METKEYRCSSLPLLFACPASAGGTNTVITSHNRPEALGSAVHRVIANVIEGKPLSDAVTETAARVGLSSDERVELAWLSNAAKGFWERLIAMYKGDILIEQRFQMPFRRKGQRFVLSGSPDAVFISPDGGWATIIDWKSGRVDADFHHQMMGYATLVQHRKKCSNVRIMVCYLRQQEFEARRVSADMLRDWRNEFVEKVQWDGLSYSPGQHCAFCQRWPECPAQSSMMISLSNDLYGSPLSLPVDPDDLISLWERVSVLERRLHTLQDLIKQQIAVGPVRGTAKTLRIVEEYREHINASAAWDEIIREIPLSRLLEIISIPKGKLIGLLKDSTSDYSPAKKQDFLDRLRKVGAMKASPIKRIVIEKGGNNE